MSKFLTRWLLIVAFFMPWVTQAQQTLTVCDGTETNGYLPVHGYYNDSRFRNEFIYPATMLTDLSGATITELTFFSSDATISWNSPLTITIDEVDDTAYTASSGNWKVTPSASEVWSGTCSVTGGQWTVTLDEPYFYGGGNLLVSVRNTAAGSLCPQSHFYGVVTSYYAAGYCSGGAAASATTYSSRQQFLPKMEIAYTTGGSVCRKPGNLQTSGVGVNAFTVSWSPRNNESEWLVYLNGEYLATSYDSIYPFSNLNANTDYTVCIRALCGYGDTSAATVISQRTACGIISHDLLPWNDNLNAYTSGSGNIPPCFATLGSGSYPYLYSYYNHEGTGNSLYFSPSSVSVPQFAVLPAMDSVGDIALTFWARSTSTTTAIRVGCMTDPTDSATFVPMATLHNSTTGTWEEFEVDFSAYNGTAQYVAIAVSGSYSSVYVDDLSIAVSNPCKRPAQVWVSDVMSDEATIHWTDTLQVGSYYIEYAIADTNDADYQVLSTSATDDSVTLYNLIPNKNYIVNVYTNCGTLSDPRPVAFHTACLNLTDDDIPYTENFDSYTTGASASINSCWTRLSFYSNNPNNPYPSSSYAHSAPNSIGFYPGHTYEPQFLVLPGVDNIGDKHIRFWAYTPSSSYTRITLGVMTNATDTTSFEPLQTYSLSASNTWQEFEYNFSSYEGNGHYIALRGGVVSSWGYWIYVDDIELNFANSCARLTDAWVTDITSEEATFHWTDTSANGNYFVEYFISDTTDADYVILTDWTSDDSLLVSDLVPNKYYTVNVYNDCGDLSDPRSFSFKTACVEYASDDLPMVEDLESRATNDNSVINPCWTKYQTSSSGDLNFTSAPYVSDYYAHNGSKSVYMSAYSASSANYVVLQPFEESVENLYFSCAVRAGYHYESNTYHFQVGLMSDPLDPATFVMVKEASNISDVWSDVETGFAGLADSGNYIAFRYYGSATAYVDDITVDYAPSCVRPDNVVVSAIAGTTAVVSWSDLSNAGSYYVEYFPASDSNNIVSLTVTDTMAVQLTGLTPQTDYVVNVFSDCGTMQSDARGTSFQTVCLEVAASDLPYTITFDSLSTLAPCWNLLYNNGYSFTTYMLPEISTVEAHSANKSMNMTSIEYYDYYDYEDYEGYSVAMAPVFESPIQSLAMSFWYKVDATSARLAVGISSTTSDTSTFTRLLTVAPADTSWHRYEVDLSGYMGNGTYITFIQYSDGTLDDNDENGYIDDITVEALGSCTRPAAVTASAVSTNSATIEWVELNSVGTYKVKWSDSDSTTVTGATTLALTSLTANTEYTVEVSRLCDGTYTEPRTLVFRTACAAVAHSELPWTEDFESYTTGSSNELYIPCWTITNPYFSGYSWYPYVNAYNNHTPSGNNGLLIYALNEPRPIVALPLFADSLNALQLSFYTKCSTSGASIDLGVMGDPANAATFTLVQTVPVESTSDWTYHEILFADSLQGFIAFRGNSSNSVYIDDIVVREKPNCLAPTGLTVSNITGTTADVTVVDDHQLNHYVLRWSNSDSVILTAANHTLTGLTPATAYTLTVYGICNDNSVTSSRSTSFVTACDAITALPWLENFDAMPAANTGIGKPLPTCWKSWRVSGNTAVSDSTKVYINTNSPASAPNSLIMISALNSSQTPSTYTTIVKLPDFAKAIDSLQMSFDVRFTTALPSEHVLEIGVLTDPSNYASFVPVDTVDHPGTTTWSNYEMSFAGHDTLAGSIAFRYAYLRNADYYYAYIDNLTVSVITSCLRPQAVSVSNITATSADVTIVDTNQANSYLLVYSHDNGSDTITVYGNSVQLANLLPGTHYTLSAATLCANGDVTTTVNADFTTNCLDMTHADLPYGENFDALTTGSSATLAPCWNKKSYSTSSSYPYPYAYIHHGASGNSLYFYPGGAGQEQYVTMPSFDSVNDLMLTFWAYNASGNLSITVGVMDNIQDTTTFIPVQSVQNTASSTWEEFEVDMRALTATAKVIAFRVGSAATYNYTSVYIDDIVLDLAPSCSKPTSIDVSNITTTTAQIAITDPTNTGHYRVKLGNDSVDILSSNYTLTNLAPATAYTVSVASICSDGAVTRFVDAAFVTAICDGATVVQIGDSAASTSTSGMVPFVANYNYSVTEIIIDSAELADLTEVSAMTIYMTSDGPYDTKDSVDIYLMPTNMTSFVNTYSLPANMENLDTNKAVHVFSGALHLNQGLNYIVFDQPFTLPDTGNVMLIFDDNSGAYLNKSFRTITTSGVYKSQYIYRDASDIDPLALDSYTTGASVGTLAARPDMQLISCGASCPQPSGLTVSALSYNSADLLWSGNSTTYEVALKNASEAIWPEAVSVSQSNYAASNLQPATAYQFRVRTVCDENAVSEWSMITFTTDSLPCFAPSALQTTAVDLTTATFDWTVGGEETMWNIHVWNTSFDQNFEVTTHPATVTGLTQTTTYYVAVSALCGNGAVESEYSDTIQFTTATCSAPTAVAVSGITAHTAVVTWQGSAANYTIEYGETGFAEGTGTQVSNISATTYTIEGLESGYIYDVYVRSDCDAHSSSDWSSQTFTTAVGIDAVDGVNVTLYPNPTSTSTVIALSGVNGEVSITIVDMNGRTVRTDSMSCEGDCVKTIEVSGLAQGAYFVRVNGDNVNTVKKLVVK